jgi:arylsulfatase A-like enzyme
MDEQIGRIFAALDEAGETGSTLVVFTADQGLAMSSHGLMGKQNMYEHTVGVPLIMAGPNLPVGKQFAAQCYLRDVFPTACEIAGIAIPDTVQGRSLTPVLQGKTDQLYPFVVAYFTGTQRMIRDERWKFVSYPQARQTQLFDLKNDSLELNNLAADPTYQATRRELELTLSRWLQERGDPDVEK